jgi:YD repeat-containing protein
MLSRKLAVQGLFVFALTALGGVNYTYDSAGRLTTINYGNGSVVTYTYDAAGNLISRTVGTGGGGGGACTYTLSLGGQAFGAAGGNGVVNVAANSGCAWSASGAPGWVTFSSGSGSGNGSASYAVAANSGVDRAVSVTIAGQSFTIEQEAASISGLSLIGSMAHLAAEENWTTNFTLVNKGSAAAQARLSFFGDALDPTGNGPLALPVVFPQSSAGGVLLASSFDRTINPNASLIVTSAGSQTPPVLQGSAQLAATGAVDGFAIFHLIPGAQEAVVPMETRNASSYILAFDNTNGVVLGVAVANVSAQTAVIPIVIRDDTGAVISAAGATISLGGNSHTAFVLSDPVLGFPVTANKRGTIEFETPAGGQISVLGIRTTPIGGTNTLTTIPALANVGTGGGSIAHIATGNGWQTTFVLVNTGTTAAQAHLKFLGDDGSPLSLPLTFPQIAGGAATTAASVDQALAAGAMLLVQSAAPLSDPAPTVGSAQLTTNGNIGGFVIFRLNTNGQEAVVPLESRNANAYLLAFDNTADIATGVALNSIAAQAVNVPVVVRDDSGAQIATDTLSLPANGHYSFTLVTDKYPATAHIRGTIEFDTPANSQIGALGIRIPAAAHTFTTLPALAK